METRSFQGVDRHLDIVVSLAVTVAGPKTYRPLWHKSKIEVETNTGLRFTLDTALPRDQLGTALR